MTIKTTPPHEAERYTTGHVGHGIAVRTIPTVNGDYKGVVGDMISGMICFFIAYCQGISCKFGTD